jgi:hypothetical protein
VTSSRGVECPYCEQRCTADCRWPENHVVLIRCGACSGDFAVRFEVNVKATPLTIEGEAGRAEERFAEAAEARQEATQ